MLEAMKQSGAVVIDAETLEHVASTLARCLQENDFAAGRGFLANMLEIYPSSSEIRSHLAELEMRANRWAEAIGHWQAVIASPRHPMGAYVRLARAYLETRDFVSASNAIETCLKLNSSYAPAEDFRNLIATERRRLYSLKLMITNSEAEIIIDLNGGLYPKEDLTSKKVVFTSPWLSELDEIIIRTKKGTIDRFPIAKSSDHEAGRCFAILDLCDAASIGVDRQSGAKWLWEVEIEPILQVTIGAQGWLFLANDSNKSVELFTGKSILSNEKISEWTNHLERLEDIKRRSPLCLMVAPSKEQVKSEFYPFSRGEVTAIDQLLAIEAFHRLDGIYPLEALRMPGAYVETDTHWTDLGALIAANSCLAKFGLPNVPDDFFRFESPLSVGDLGSKIIPTAYAKRPLIVGSQRSLASRCVYHNGIETSGSIIIYTNDAPLIDKKILIFGDSFSVHLTRVLKEIFSSVTRFYSPANPILSVLDEEQPDFVLLQTNERFISTSPVVYRDLNDSPLASKIRSWDHDQKSALAQSALAVRQQNKYSDFLSGIMN